MKFFRTQISTLRPTSFSKAGSSAFLIAAFQVVGIQNSLAQKNLVATQKVSQETPKTDAKKSISNLQTISDSLVSQLQCKGLSSQNVLSFVNKNSWSVENHIPTQNWGANFLGQCWSLATAQRRFFYLVRTGVAKSKTTKKDIEYGLDISRGSHFSGDDLELRVIKVPEKNFSTSDLYYGMYQGSRSQERNFKSEIELHQQKKFYNLGNLDLLSGGNDFSKQHNEGTLHKIQLDLKRGRMPLVILRPTTTNQHVVLIKGIEHLGPKSYRMSVYDSNQPYGNGTLNYDQGIFHSTDIIGRFLPERASQAIGVTLRDEDELEEIENTLFEYYSTLCKSKK